MYLFRIFRQLEVIFSYALLAGKYLEEKFFMISPIQITLTNLLVKIDDAEESVFICMT